MNTKSNTILMTGGASGIGLALAQRFLKAGDHVIVCGRRADRLLEAQKRNPGLETRVCDVAQESERVALFEWAHQQFPKLNVLVNNAGIQRRVPLENNEPWTGVQQEIATNLEAPIHLATLFMSHLKKQSHAVIANVSSGLAFSPLAYMPVYCATKAALHSFTLSLRAQLEGSTVRVVEIIPPAVNTDLGGPGMHNFGVAVDDFADAVMKAWIQGDLEIAYGTADEARRAGPEELKKIFQRMNKK